MDKDKLIDLLRQTSQEVGVSLTTSKLELFWLYLQELLEWNKTFNLTGIKDPADIIIKHFVDSLTPLPYLDRSGRLLDIGSGAGFPGIPLKIGAPQLQVHIVDARRKKTSFLKHLIRTLELKGVTALHSRAEEMEQPEQPFQIIISRAFRRLEPLIKLVSPLMKPGNMLVAMLGPTANKEQSRFQALASVENLEIKQTVVLDLPQDRGGRTLLFLQKR
ncbi:MAG: 16S rRNA (guanine(527)-N(7))-methyltransferase RsmG [Deltaproteobacteria bacterium]|nr:MAG: 16S rRNA (guanine(527)-N(7))-methyltransferase RsmG [Deltaproteobacteria bacterium]